MGPPYFLRKGSLTGGAKNYRESQAKEMLLGRKAGACQILSPAPRMETRNGPGFQKFSGSVILLSLIFNRPVPSFSAATL